MGEGLLAAGAGLLGSIGSSLGSFFGGSMTNKGAKKIAREQMAFQERMSNTAYQRSTKDMEAAGLNPMLAYQQGVRQPRPALLRRWLMKLVPLCILLVKRRRPLRKLL